MVKKDITHLLRVKCARISLVCRYLDELSANLLSNSLVPLKVPQKHSGLRTARASGGVNKAKAKAAPPDDFFVQANIHTIYVELGRLNRALTVDRFLDSGCLHPLSFAL